MTTRREKNNHSLSSLEEANTGRQKIEKDDKYTDENFDTTDTDAAENNPRVKRASQTSGNKAEEGDEDYDDEEQAVGSLQWQ